MNNVKHNKEITIAELIRIFLKYKNKILLISLIVFILSTLFAFFVLEPIFLSTSTVKTTSKASGLTGLLSAGLPDLSEFGDLAAGGSAGGQLALFENILVSRKCVEGAIIRFKLNDEWKYKYMEQAVKHFRTEVIEITKDKIAGTMEIGIYDKNPLRAKEIVDFMISQLNEVNIELNVQDAKNNREFIEARYEEVKTDLKNAEDSLKVFQYKFGVAPDLLIKTATTSALQIEAEIKSEEVKLDILRKIVAPDQPEIKAQEEKIIALKQQLNSISDNYIGDNILSLKGAPDVALNFIRLSRDVEIQNKILTFVVPLVEQAKVEEKKEMPSVLILDPPIVPEVKAKPKRIIIILIATFIAGFISFLIFFTYTKWKEFKDSNDYKNYI